MNAAAKSITLSLWSVGHSRCLELFLRSRKRLTAVQEKSTCQVFPLLQFPFVTPPVFDFRRFFVGIPPA